ncbi:MAG: Nif3-like dinuclear metal center hexameric protein [Nocardioidaceae bacterium]
MLPKPTPSWRRRARAPRLTFGHTHSCVVVELLHGWYPPESAESWDAVGLVYGDPAATVRRVLLAVDPVLPVADEAADWSTSWSPTTRCSTPSSFRGDTPEKVRTLKRFADASCALLAAHTNADLARGRDLEDDGGGTRPVGAGAHRDQGQGVGMVGGLRRRGASRRPGSAGSGTSPPARPCVASPARSLPALPGAAPGRARRRRRPA